ncbi:hypothetical protein HQ865_15430 [Mucilaginibacter mali]|uniref:FAS1 domain-containing protein n=1 Tax=Mucilaginibacter mali TaxID=2740462 RepID=A0A7D4Q263_9SPHI|nr:hypothetical protein [Mucilaginibacter mali]QKJ31086.1 hypothetical protein HQ865_15430 [Mucilaginibacter mali]
MMRNKNIKRFSKWSALVLIILSVATACKKDSIYYDYENKVKEFDGTALQYLQAQKGTFDSLLVVLDRLPALKDSLSTKNITLFAPTNQSFQAAIKNLNIERKAQGKQVMYLKDCDLNELDVLTTRYILRDIRTTDSYAPFADGLNINSIKYAYPMHVQYNKLNASGFVGGGPQAVIFSDPKGSIFEKYWENANTNAVNIKTKNAIVNILAPLHDYGFNEFVVRVNK